MPGAAVTVFTLWFERDAAIEKSEERIVSIAKQLTLHQKNMVDDVKRLTVFLADKAATNEKLPTTCPDYFFEIKALYSNIANIGIVNAEGELQCVTNGRSNNINISDRAYFQNAISNRDFSVGYFQYDRSIQAQSVNFAYPIIDTDNNLKGTLVTVIALNWWNIALNEAELPDNAKAVIADPNGLILANYPSRPDKLGKKITDTDLLHDKSSLTVFKNTDGENQIFHRSVIYNDAHHNNLDIYIAVSVEDFINEVNASFLKTIFAFLTAIALLVLLARRLIKASIFNPIANLSNATDELAHGTMPKYIKKPNSPELRALYNRFEVMAQTRLSAEAKLKNKHNELMSLLNALPDTYMRINALGDVLYIGGHISSLLTVNTKTSLNLVNVLPKENAQLLLSHLNNVDSSQAIEFKLRVSTTEHFFEARINTLESNNEFIVVLRDISQKRINEKALHLASLVYSNSSEGMAITDPNGVIYDVNPAFCKTTQYSKEEVIGKTSHILSSGKHPKEFYQQMWAELRSTGRWQGEIINRKKNGDIYTEWLKIDTVYDDKKIPTRRVAIFTDITDKKQADETIWRQTHFDHLTDLPNRLELKERLNQRFNAIQNEDNNLVVMLLDIDRFKDINDTLGHHYGDNLLKLVSQRIVHSAKNAEFVARIGGDEFVIVFNHIKSIRHINQIASNILQSLSSGLMLENEEIFISASMGIACAPSDGQSTEQLLKAADQAMYKAKSNGRNGFEFFSADMRIRAQARMQLLKDLRSAIELHQFELFYQPIVALNDLHIHKAEGLIRWHHPVNGLVSPDSFIPLAEETRQINVLGQFVFAQAIQTLTEIKAASGQQFQISVNVSPVQLSTADSGIDDWCDMLAAAKLPASSIVAEITEGLMVNPEALTQSRLKRLVQSGMELALDDFGTGYSSLAYLQEMDTDYLKIDKRFVDNIKADSQELALCEAIIVMAHQLGLKVIAEGIETPLQMELLLKAGCDYGQGYLFAKPMPKKEFMTLLSSNKVVISNNK
ncbi:diguanylate phosphodiesterase [Pseudoalteromonas sp. S3178]|uniref:bifunctional diguanylate cyclase/phosphodiesterase n=1 Tax=Pseudoalteromonas sp. S3178 TaxID=579532 RepID=UPI00110B5F94|nr:EAL domain-containing protein [Pseudoalteromonas sp. S3178]TMP08742.1 diguanylate phosphodiesterase [Pseudoalteromonas sp. S3178]